MRPPLRSRNQAPRLGQKVLAGCCHSAWLVTGQAQPAQAEGECHQERGQRSDQGARRQEHEQRRQGGQQGGDQGGAVPPPEAVGFDVDEQVQQRVHRQPGQRGADAEGVDVDLRARGRGQIVEASVPSLRILAKLK